jgi:hypothetical protein
MGEGKHVEAFMRAKDGGYGVEADRVIRLSPKLNSKCLDFQKI